MVKVIIFDFGGVLGSDADEWKTTFKKIPKMTGLTPAIIQEIFEKHWTKLKLGKESLKVFWEEIAKIAKIKISADMLMQSYCRLININKEAFNFARKLKKREYKLVILANESKEGIETKITKFNLQTVFEKIYCSALIGLAKPDLRVFNYVLKDLGIKSQETIFIDNQLKNIEAAKELGIPSVLFTSLKNLQKEIAL